MLKRAICPMPEEIAMALEARGIMGRYDLRPSYQKNDYLSWILRAKRQETRTRRLLQMLDELEAGDKYMGMAYRSKGEKRK